MTQYAPTTSHNTAQNASPQGAFHQAQNTGQPAYAGGAMAMSRPGADVGSYSGGKTTSKLEQLTGQIDSSTLRILSALAVGFLIFYVVMASILMLSMRSSHNEAIAQQSYDQSTRIAEKAAQNLDGQLMWIEQALSSRGNAQQIVDLVARGNNVTGALIVDGTGKALAATPNAASAAAAIPVTNFPETGVKIISLIGENGQVNPVIMQRAGTAYLAAILASGALVDHQNSNSALVLTGGGLIDAPSSMGQIGVLSYLGLGADRFEAIRNRAPLSLSVNNEPSYLTLRNIPNSTSIAALSLTAKTTPPNFTLNLMVLSVLFLGICLLFWMLLRNLLRQLDVIETTNQDNEVSQQRYRAAIEGNRGGIWEIDPDNNTAFVSRSLASLLGMSAKDQEITVPQFLGLFHEQDRERLYSLVRRAHVSGDFEVDMHVAHLPLTLSCRGRSSTRGSEYSKVVIGVAMDITEQRGASDRLRAAEARLQDALRSMNDSFALWDPRGRLVLWNRRFEDFFGFQPGNLEHGMAREIIDYHAKRVIIENHAIAGETAQDILLQDGRWIRYQETATADGGFVSIGSDLSGIRTREYQLQKNEAALQKTIDVLRKSQFRIVELAENYEQEKIRAEEASQSKSEFLANMSHELRTPLNAINGFSDIMKKEMFGPLGDPRYKEYVNDILFSGQHLLSLINDILDMSKIEAGKMTLNTEFMQLNDMVSQVIRIVRGRAEDNRLKLIYDEAEVREIESDPRAVKQVLLNLMTNAIKFTPEGGAVTCEVIPKSAGMMVRISDTGIGIAQEDLDRLAKPFEQIDSQHSRKHEGTGLGLALSKSLVELHGGNFIIESVLGQGTTVTFTLPNQPPETKATEEDSEVGNEISRLAQDIADVLTDNSTETDTDDMSASAATMPAVMPPPTGQATASQAPPPAQPMPPAQAVPYQPVQAAQQTTPQPVAPPPAQMTLPPMMPPHPHSNAQPQQIPPPPKPQSAA